MAGESKSYRDCKILFFILFLAFTSKNICGQQIKSPIEPREIAMTLLNLEEDDPDHGLRWIREMNSVGVTTIIMTVRWDMVYEEADSKANWSLFDKQVKLISDLGMKAGLRIHLGRKRMKWEGFWSDDDIMRDFRGIPSIYGYAESHASYASQTATEKAVDFIKEVCERYKPYQQSGNIKFVNISSNQYQESGYFYNNQELGSPYSYQALFDFSKPSIKHLQAEIEKKYKNVNTLNKYWITKYTKFSQAAPYTNGWDPEISFLGKRGKDFYMSRHLQLKEFLKTTGDAIKSIDSGYLVCYDFGSLTDEVSHFRGTYNAASLSEHCDILKHNDERMQWSFDILAHNVNKPLYNEIHFRENYSIQEMINLTDWYFENGSSLVAYLIANDEHLRIFKEVTYFTRRWKSEPIRPIIAEKKMDIYVSQLVDNYDKVFSRWVDISKNGSIKVAINLKEDVLEEERIDVLPYKSPEELAELYGYYGPDADTNQGAGIITPGGGNPNSGGGVGVVVNPPPTPTPPDTTNSLPYALRRFTPEQLIIREAFLTRLDNDIFLDEDGYIANIELVSGPEWLTFYPQGFFFTGRPPELGEYEVKLRAYDNRGAWVEDSFTFEVIRPLIDFTVIEADYFDVPIIEWADIEDGQTLYIDELPQFMNIIAKCNVDSIKVEFEMTGPFYKKNLSERLPFNLFGEGRGYYPVEGTYQLNATALKGDSVITSNSISFTLLTNRSSDEPAKWTTYPNPFVDVCNVKMPADIEPTSISFKLVDLSGRAIEIDESQVTSVEQTSYINLRKNRLQQGAYFLQAFLNDEMVYQFKIFKK